MAALIILVLYAIVIIIYVLISLFIVYHLVRFSVESELKVVMLVAFVFVTAGLLLANLMLFFSIDWNSLVAKFLA